MTAAMDREVLREWRDRHGDVRPDHGSGSCTRQLWIDGEYAGPCGRVSQWIVRKRPLCEPHTVERIQQWLDFERGEVPA